MAWNTHGVAAQDGDLIQLVGLQHKSFIFRLKAGGELQTHRGVVKHDAILGMPWGSLITSHMGNPFYVFQPSLADLLREIPRNTQILYPKDIGFILVTMGIGPGSHVIEAGTGSGALTSAMAYSVGETGSIVSYDAKPESQQMARKNLERLGLLERVTLKIGNAADGFEETGADALFLDLPNPYDYIPQVRAALKLGGFFGSILPTANQVSLLLSALRQNRFAFIDVCEIMLRYYKAEPERFRPVDRMVAHTGYLIFARPVALVDPEEEKAIGIEDENDDEPMSEEEA